MSKFINIFEPNIPSDSHDLLKKVFSSKWLGRGALASEFDDKLSKFTKINRTSMMTMSCCTDAIFGILKLLPVHNSRKTVIVPSVSFPAVGSAVIEAGLNLKIIDVNQNTGNICYDSLEKELGSDVLAIFLTHYGGGAVDTDKIRDLVGNEVYILEDSACAFGSFYESGHAVGSKADFSCWSFDAMKLLVAGEGGAAYVKDFELLQRLKEYLYLGLPMKEKSGMDKSDADENWWEYQLNELGARSVFTDISAAIAIPQFKNLQESINLRATFRQKYIESINKNSFIDYATQENCSQYSNYFFTVISDTRDDFARYMKANGVYCTFRYFPLSDIKIFQNYAEICDVSSSNIFSRTAINIPIHHNLSFDDVDKISNLLISYKGA